MPADCSPSVAQAMADSQVANQKIVQDTFASRENQAAIDNQSDSRAWGALKLRRAENSATFDHFINMTTGQATATAEQTGQTANEAAVDPIRTATGDAIAAVPGVAAGSIASTIAVTPAQLAALIAALVPVVTASSGSATAKS